MISIIIPAYNEEQNIPLLCTSIEKAMNENKIDYEAILINDGSSDNTLQQMKKCREKNQKFRIISFKKNFGQTAAMDAGIQTSKGDIIVMMDADLQNDPSDIKLLLKKMEEGYDVVSGWRHTRKDPLFSKKIPSKIANCIGRKLTGINIHDSGCSLKAYKKETLKGIRLYGEMHRYIPALVSIKGFKVAEVKVKHHERKYGKTKYNAKRIIKGFLDLLYLKFWADFRTRPLHLFGSLGIFQFFLSFIIIIEQIIKSVTIGRFDLGPLLILAVLLIMTGTLCIFFGFMGEILVRTYYIQSEEEPYLIEETIG